MCKSSKHACERFLFLYSQVLDGFPERVKYCQQGAVTLRTPQDTCAWKAKGSMATVSLHFTQRMQGTTTDELTSSRAASNEERACVSHDAK